MQFITFFTEFIKHPKKYRRDFTEFEIISEKKWWNPLIVMKHNVLLN